MTYPSLYRAKTLAIRQGTLVALVPQVFGEVPITITDIFGATPTEPGMGWVFFQAGNCEFPVWASGLGAGGSGGDPGTDEVWVGEDDPSAEHPTIELWFDPENAAPAGAMLASRLWTWEAISDPPLPNAKVAVDTAPGALTSMVYLARRDLMGIDWSLTVANLRAGDRITLQYAPDATSWHRFQLTDAPWEENETWNFPVTAVAGSAPGTAPPVGSSILVSFEVMGTTPGGPQSFIFIQAVPVATWVIEHRLGFRPNVLVEDSAGSTVEGEIAYDSDDQLTLTFSAAFSGTAYLS